MESRNGGLGTADLDSPWSPILVTGHKTWPGCSRQLDAFSSLLTALGLLSRFSHFMAPL